MRNHLPLTLSFVLAVAALFAQDETDLADLREARQTLQQSLNALRTTYTADIEFDVPELEGLEANPTLSYKQRVFEDGTGDISTVTSGGYVQGICPTDWHIPTADEMAALQTKTADQLNSTEHWVGPYAPFHNTLKFTAEPAGHYNNALSRFEGLTTETGFWSAVAPASSSITTTTLMCIAYYCDVPFTKTVTLSDGYSVRCVKKKE